MSSEISLDCGYWHILTSNSCCGLQVVIHCIHNDFCFSTEIAFSRYSSYTSKWFKFFQPLIFLEDRINNNSCVEHPFCRTKITASLGVHKHFSCFFFYKDLAQIILENFNWNKFSVLLISAGNLIYIV